MYRVIGVMMAVALVADPAAAPAQEIWASKDGNIRNVATRAMVIDDSGLYLATRNEIYHARGVKDKWETVFMLPAGENEITCMSGRGENLFIGTRRGVFRSQDRGATWKNVFKTMIPEKSNILAMGSSKYAMGRLVIATERGLFLSEDSGGRWQDISGALKSKSVLCVAIDRESIYACADDGLYIRSWKGGNWERVYVTSMTEREGEGSDAPPLEIEDDIILLCAGNR